MHRRSFLRAGRERMDDLGDVRLERSLRARDDDPAAPEIDDDDDLDTDDPEDDDEPATVTTAPVPAAPTSPSNPTLSSSTRSIPTLTAIAHTPTFPSSTTTAQAAKPTSTSASAPVGFTTVTTPTARQSSAAASSLIVSTTTASAILVSATSGPLPSGVMRPEQQGKPLLNSPTRSQLTPGAKAGIAIGVIGMSIRLTCPVEVSLTNMNLDSCSSVACRSRLPLVETASAAQRQQQSGTAG